MDPDPDPRHPGTDPGSGFWKIIRILPDPAPNPQHCKSIPEFSETPVKYGSLGSETRDFFLKRITVFRLNTRERTVKTRAVKMNMSLRAVTIKMIKETLKYPRKLRAWAPS
jgi:hypothetical protein